MGPRRSKVPELEPLSAPQNDEERKHRQRLHVKRTYYKKLNEMHNQRNRVHQLEKELARLVVEKKKPTQVEIQQPTPVSPDSIFPNDADVLVDVNSIGDNEFLDEIYLATKVEETLDGSVSGPQCSMNKLKSLHDQYTEITELKEKLLAENEILRSIIDDHKRFEAKLMSLLHADDVVAEDDSNAYRRAILKKPLTREFCQDFARRAYDDMWQHRQSRGFVSTGMSVFGWRDKRLPFGDRVRFSLEKRFQGRTALEQSLRGWTILSSHQSTKTMYSASVNGEWSTVQVIDDDNKLLFRILTSTDGKLLAKTPYIVTRFALPNGFAICIKNIDSSLLVPSNLPTDVVEKWVDHSTWVTFECAGDDNEHCDIAFSGELQISPLVPQSAWLLEILFIILRFEAKMTGTVYSLC